MLQILPLVGLRVFEAPRAVAVPGASVAIVSTSQQKGLRDTVVVPAQQEGFENVFLGEKCWHSIRGGGAQRLSDAHYASVAVNLSRFTERAESPPLVFRGPGNRINHFRRCADWNNAGPRYTRLISYAKTLGVFS